MISHSLISHFIGVLPWLLGDTKRCVPCTSIIFESVSWLVLVLSRTLHQAGDNLAKCLKGGRDLMSSVAIGTSKKQDLEDKEWRNKIAYYTCLTLRLIIASSDYESDKVVPWKFPELHGEIRDRILRHTQMTGVTGRWAHAARVEKEEVYRFPLTMMQYLRMALVEKSTSYAYSVDKINEAYCE